MKPMLSDVRMRKDLLSDSLDAFTDCAISWMLNSGESDETVEKAYRDFSDLEQLAIQKALAERQVDKRVEIMDWLNDMDDDEGEKELLSLQPHELAQVREAVEYFEIEKADAPDENADDDDNDDEDKRVSIQKYGGPFVRTA